MGNAAAVLFQGCYPAVLPLDDRDAVETLRPPVIHAVLEEPFDITPFFGVGVTPDLPSDDPASGVPLPKPVFDGFAPAVFGSLTLGIETIRSKKFLYRRLLLAEPHAEPMFDFSFAFLRVHCRYSFFRIFSRSHNPCGINFQPNTSQA